MLPVCDEVEEGAESVVGERRRDCRVATEGDSDILFTKEVFSNLFCAAGELDQVEPKLVRLSRTHSLHQSFYKQRAVTRGASINSL